MRKKVVEIWLLYIKLQGDDCYDRFERAQSNTKWMWKKQFFLPRKADGETVPLLRATITLMPVSTNGTEKSMISERSSLMVREPMAMSARLYTT